MNHHQWNLPAIKNEDIICSWRGEHTNNYLKNLFTSSCVNQRHSIIEQTIFSHVPNDITNDYLLAFKCYSNIPTSDNPLCLNFCSNKTCIDIIENIYPDMFFYPSAPIAYSHIYFAYTKQNVTTWRGRRQIPSEYICYNEQLCGGFHSNKIFLFNGKTCRRPEDFPVYFYTTEKDSYMSYIEQLYIELSHCNGIINDNSMICNSTNMYQCKNSSKYIPNFSVGNGIQDCDYEDDEDQTTNK